MIIISSYFNLNQLQPSSIDLTLSDECYEIRSSFLSPNNKVRNKIKNFIKKKIKLKNGHILKKNVTLLDSPNYAVMIRSTNFEQDDFHNLKYL